MKKTAIKYKSISISEANHEVVSKVAEDVQKDLGISCSINDAQAIMASAYWELKKIKIKQRETPVDLSEIRVPDSTGGD